MNDREKVISEFERCIGSFSPADTSDEYFICVCKRALELLKEQRPHLLTLDEADAAEVVWFEARNHIFIEPMLTRGKRLSDETEDWFRYGREWRCWSARPTDTQQEEEPWDEITG